MREPELEGVGTLPLEELGVCCATSPGAPDATTLIAMSSGELHCIKAWIRGTKWATNSRSYPKTSNRRDSRRVFENSDSLSMESSYSFSSSVDEVVSLDTSVIVGDATSKFDESDE
jgi:hypothetical protein